VTGQRFVPGTVLAGRYRIVGLIGRGGMGEVYRADDLKLEQPVALKFLPSGLDAFEDRLARFYREVRVARQVSHPAVCRVYDVGEADGHLFLSMELVDGENLASLLRRIGRLPPDKAKDIARQLCAGLAAAHEKGVLHRDLKPANVMLDGEGNVRITDFGLAGLAESLGEEDVRSGTPSYMSPEQLLGREVSVRSDIYGLGLLLYELFTGRRAFTGRGVAELTRKHRDERPIEPAALVPGLDPAVERAILACLEKEPRRRPGSALVVAAMLTGSDPLEAAIAAGETPSPELVASAGEREGLSRGLAFTLLGLVLAGLAAVPLVGTSMQLVDRLPLEKPPAVLEDRARELLRRMGVTAPAADDAWGLLIEKGYLMRVRDTDASPRRWDVLGSGEPPVLKFWYRQSPRPLLSYMPAGSVYWSRPPLEVTDMAGVAYDMRGRLQRFYAIPKQFEQDAAGSSQAPDWATLFREAQLPLESMRPVAPQWSPPFDADARAAWEGPWPGRPDVTVRVEAASWRGRPVWFELVWPWSVPERQQTWAWPKSKLLRQAVWMLVALSLLGAAGFMARRNLVLGRGDRRGAFRVAALLVGIGFASWAFGAHHVADWNAQFELASRGLGTIVLHAAAVWLFYLAVEPYARRLRPWTLVSWTRLLGGGVSDPVVGRDVLAGLVWALGFMAFQALAHHLPSWLGQPASDLHYGAIDAVQGGGPLLAAALAITTGAILFSLGFLLMFVLLRLLLRRDALAGAAALAIAVVPALGGGDLPWSAALVSAAWLVTWLALLLRFGLLAAIVGMLVHETLTYLPLTTDLTAWTAGPTWLALALTAALAVLAFRSAQGGTGLRRYLDPATSSRP
jgi:serine/threonine-protein kinase